MMSLAAVRDTEASANWGAVSVSAAAAPLWPPRPPLLSLKAFLSHVFVPSADL